MTSMGQRIMESKFRQEKGHQIESSSKKHGQPIKKKKNNVKNNKTEHTNRQFAVQRHCIKKKEKSALNLALEEFKIKKEEQFKRKKEISAKKEEMSRALKKYNENKSQKLKRMSRKTKKGQPIMKYWMENLLEKIKNGNT